VSHSPLPSGGPRGVRLAYAVGTFPALTETFVQREIRGLQGRGFDVVVLAIRRPKPAQRSNRLAVLGPDVRCIYGRPDGLIRHLIRNLLALVRRPGRYLVALRLFLGEASKLSPRDGLQLLYHFFVGVGFAQDLRRLGVHHVHGHFTSACNAALAMHLVEGTQFSFTAHASNDLFVRPVFLPEKTARAHFVVAVCEYSRRYLDSLTAFRFSAKIHRIYNGVEIAEVSANSRVTGTLGRTARPQGELARIISVGSLVPPKGHASLIQACARLRSQGERFTCRIVGEGPERRTIERLIDEHGLAGCVDLLGALPLDQVYEELSRADVFVLLCEIGASGYRDGFPTVILEAMAAELPVLSTNLSGIPEMVSDGVTGILVPERDVEAASSALQRLLSSGDLRRTLGLAGRARVNQLFNLDRSIESLSSLFRLSASPAGKHILENS